MKPYVVSEDIDVLLERWAKRHSFQLPPASFFKRLRKQMVCVFTKMFTNVEFIPSRDLVNPSSPDDVRGLPFVTLDRVYADTPYRIELSRTVGSDLSDGPVGTRGGAPDLQTQLATLKGALNGQTDIVIYDDVVFSGHFLSEACRTIEGAGLRIRKVLCGIGIDEGVERVTQGGWSIECLKTYAEVVDQVCERDFYPGVDCSGRTLASNPTFGLPYLRPFGDPVKWASIPAECAADFSRFCITQSIDLFREIGRVSGRAVPCSVIDRKLANMGSNGASFVDYLADTQKHIK